MLSLFVHNQAVMRRHDASWGISVTRIYLVENDCKRQKLGTRLDEPSPYWLSVDQSDLMLLLHVQCSWPDVAVTSCLCLSASRCFHRDLVSSYFFPFLCHSWREADWLWKPGKLKTWWDAKKRERVEIQQRWCGTPMWKMKLFPTDCHRGTSGSTDVHH